MLISRAAHSMVSGCLFRPGRRPLCAVVTFWSIVWVPCVRPGPVWRRTNMPITPPTGGSATCRREGGDADVCEYIFDTVVHGVPLVKSAIGAR